MLVTAGDRALGARRHHLGIRGDPDASATISDVFWLAWYPLHGRARSSSSCATASRASSCTAGSTASIVMLVVITPWVALFLEPAAQHVEQLVGWSTWSTSPIRSATRSSSARRSVCSRSWGGAARPMWIGARDRRSPPSVSPTRIYSVDALGHTYSSDTVFDALWLGGMVVIAYAAWLPHPGRSNRSRSTAGRRSRSRSSRRCFALGLQVYGLFFYVPARRARAHDRRAAHRHRADRRESTARPPTTTVERSDEDAPGAR